MKKIIITFFLVIIIVACFKIDSGSTNADFQPISGVLPNDESQNEEYTIRIDNLDEDEVYLIVTNQMIYTKRSNNIDFETIFSNNNLNNLAKSKTPKESFVKDRTFKYDYDPKIEQNEKISKVTSKNIVKATVGEDTSFNVIKMGKNETNVNIIAKLTKSIVKNNRTFNFWVENTVYSGSVFVREKVNNIMINALADKFIESNKNIYEGLTHIFGNEWFDNTSSRVNLIDGTKTVDILIFNINNNYDGARVVGYFNPDDLFKKNYVSKSNERVMFYLDAYSLASSGSTWDSKNYWPDITISTLAHEFMHLITFYQKVILRQTQISTWLNEMMAMLAEDIISYDIDTYGPRGISGKITSAGITNNSIGRLPEANYYNYFPANASTMSSYINYSVTYSYGAYLLRNYGVGTNGLQFLRDIILSKKQDVNAIEEALFKEGYNLTFANTISDWSKAVVLSNEILTNDEKYKYQSGNGFRTSIDGREFTIGDINMYNYDSIPAFFLSGGESLPKLNRGNNLYFYFGKGTGKFNMTISIPKYSSIQIIVKDKNGKYDINKSNARVERLE